jgi:hypothetical protein
VPRFRLPVTRGSAEDVVILSDIPERHPDKAVIEEALHAAVERFDGPWIVEVLIVGSGAWWLVCFERPTDGLTSAILLPPWEQGPQRISEGVGNLLARTTSL